MQGTIRVETIRCYAHHGCMPEETAIGQNYEVDVVLHFDAAASAASDRLSDTIDYVAVNRIVTTEMAIPSRLIEHVASRILHRLRSSFPLLTGTEVTVRKINPPIEGDVRAVSITLVG
jgi:7,8-dihydroneopterin aldolase/epimerase/oxygenase